ncbi:MotA/TolQ/ExbB proton channel family protein [Aquibium sp. LZ166]|uniref:MotA/TolQ/ExbB proton channel family protein n=1 Tax=Aquibium pacificus TaxID=3153579 RepID=A0ABV3SHY5_9HYPH
MTWLRTLGEDGLAGGAQYDPHKLSSPQVFLLSMLIFLAIAGFVAAILYRQISTAFATNPGLNGLILGVLAVGILLAFNQVIRLFREVRWVNSFRAGQDTRNPVLLAPMKALLSRSSATALSTNSMRSILDSIATRLDESRDISRYLIGLLVFLGLLGTFWGLLQTIGSIGSTIQSLDPGSGDTNDILNSLKSGLSAPLAGMGTAFSSSLFGLAGSLVLGFLDLQAGRAQNRFYTELENWLSSVTDVGSDAPVLDTSRADTSEEMRRMAEQLRSLHEVGGSSQRVATSMASLAEGISGLVKNMRNEQQIMRDWVEAQAEEQKEMRETLKDIADSLRKMDRVG